MKNMATGLTANDLAERLDRIAASDVPCVMGTSKRFNLADVYKWKNEPLEPMEVSDAMEWGHEMEIPLLKYTQKVLRKFLNEPGLKITRRGTRCKHKNGIMSCTLDAKIEGRNEAVEVKTHNVTHRGVDISEWGEAWTDAIPADVLDQVLAQQACCPELIRTWVVLWVGCTIPVIYCVERANHLEHIDLIELTCCDAWDTYIYPKVPPPMAPHMETVKRDARPRQSLMAVAIADEPVMQSKSLAAQISALTSRKKNIDAGIRSDMTGATRGMTPGGHLVVISSSNRKGYSVDPCIVTRMDITLADALLLHR